jgi:glycosyltransferase involved in cell wall biosynthesis
MRDDTPVIGTAVISYKRPELLRLTLTSYLTTVTGPYQLVVIDNGDSEEALEVAADLDVEVLALLENRYPGYATNVGWSLLADADADYLHRSDNDVEFLAGWCDEVLRRFDANPSLGQLGLRTVEEEGRHPNVGGNCVVRWGVFQKIRWQEVGWQPGVKGEDYYFTTAVQAAGWNWTRVTKPCIVHRGKQWPDQPRDDPYYVETWGAKGVW